MSLSALDGCLRRKPHDKGDDARTTRPIDNANVERNEELQQKKACQSQS